jgi:hypothetical protein
VSGRGVLAAGRGGQQSDPVTERTDTERWADAESILDGDPTEFALSELRRFRRRMRYLIWSLGAFLVLVVAAGVVVALLGGHSGHHAAAPTRTPLWQEIAGLCLNGLGLVLIVVGLVRYFRSAGRRAAWRSPALVLTRAQRRELSAQIRGRAPVQPERVRLARYLADLAGGPHARRFFALLFSGLVLELVGQLITFPSTWRLIYTGVFLVVYVVLVGVVARRWRQIQGFLDRTGSPA